MKILNVINVRWFNATAWYSHMLSLGLRELGHEAAIIGLPDSPPLLKAKEAGFLTYAAKLNSVNPVNLMRSALTIKKANKEFKPDVVVCHRGEFFFYFTHMRYWEKPKWKLVRVRGDRRPPKSDALSRWLYHNAVDKVITSSEAMRRYYIDKLKLAENKAVTIYGGVDTDYFRYSETGRERIRKEFGFSSNDKVLGIVGRFDTVKGHDSLFRAISGLYNSDMPNIRLIVAGVESSMNAKDMERMIRENGIQDITVLVGKREDMPDIMSAMDLGVIPSLGSEAICRVGMEMLSCGIPVIGSDIGVIPEILPPSNIFRAGDAEDIKTKIKEHRNYLKSYSHLDFAEQFLSALTD